MKYTATILGAQGYTGRELARLLLNHPYIALTQVFSRNPDWHLRHDLPELASDSVEHCLLPDPISGIAEACKEADIIFLATPHEVSLECVPYLYKANKWIIDLSGAFRLPAPLFHEWYQQPHTAHDLLEKAQYGLSPFQSEPAEKLIANPGCYATAVLMALLPLAKAGLVKAGSLKPDVIIDAKSGISGAGRSAKTELLFSEMSENFFPYKVGAHQHTPEIQQVISDFSGVNTQITLTTQVLPIIRGISATLYIPCDTHNAHIMEEVKKAYNDSYENYPFVRHAHLPELNVKEQKTFLSLKKVVGSARTHISYQKVGNHIVVFSMLDNLLKGAASQAIENANRVFGLPLTSGLENCEGTL